MKKKNTHFSYKLNASSQAIVSNGSLMLQFYIAHDLPAVINSNIVKGMKMLTATPRPNANERIFSDMRPK